MQNFDKNMATDSSGRTGVGPTSSSTQKPADQAAGFEILDTFRRFSQRNDVFSRSFWDPRIRSEKTELFYKTYRRPLQRWRKVDGFTQKDYALRNAAWHVTDIFAELKENEDRREGFLDEFTVQRDGPGQKLIVDSPEAMAAEIKRVARVFGAGLVGITGLDERWLYTHKYSAQTQAEKPNDPPSGLEHVIVVAQEMDHGLIQTVPSALSGTATGLGYSQDVLVLLSLAQYIRNLGYQAVASLNDTALAIPLAIQAGLGEYGRHGLLITRAFGPRVRLGKIFTDLPLVHDRPTQFGVREFCQACRRCAQACPPKAIPASGPTVEIHNPSNIIGVRKWTVDGEKCFNFWANQNSDCSICIRVCPYNKDFSKWYHRLGRWLAGTRMRKLMLKLDIWLGYGRRQRSKSWWSAAE
nr:reductive dehalogenase [uncultured prokaryote]